MLWNARKATVPGKESVAIVEAHSDTELMYLDPTEARALAAELVRAADEVEPMERSCFTCRHNENEVCHHPADEMEMAIDQYGLDAGCAKNNGGMPLDRSIPCPGWSAKVTT